MGQGGKKEGWGRESGTGRGDRGVGKGEWDREGR